MTGPHSIGVGLGALAVAIGSVGCTVITAGEFEEREAPRICGNDPMGARRDLSAQLLEMNPHMEHYAQLDLVRVTEIGPLRMRQTVGRAVYDPLGEAEPRIVLPCIVGSGNYEVDLYMDSDNDRSYDPCLKPSRGCDDHQWRLQVAPDGTLEYRHGLDFVNLMEDRAAPVGGLPLTIVMSNTTAYAGMLAEFRLRRIESDGAVPTETVFLYRRRQLPNLTEDSPPLRITFEQMLIRNTRYEAAFWIDTNGNGVYDPPSSVGIGGRDYAGSTIIIGDAGGGQIVLDGDRLPAPSDIQI